MPVMFREEPGATVAVKSARAASTIFSFDKKPSQQAIATSVTYDQKVAAQFKQSLRRVLFVFPFGDDPSRVSVNLSIFLKDCNSQPTTGVADLLDYYERVKLAPDMQTPIVLSIGGAAIKAYVLGMGLNMQVVGLQTVATVRFDMLGWNTNTNKGS